MKIFKKKDGKIGGKMMVLNFVTNYSVPIGGVIKKERGPFRSPIFYAVAYRGVGARFVAEIIKIEK